MQEVSEIVTDLRIKGINSKYLNKKSGLRKELIEVLGHATMYDYILHSKDNISGYSIQDLHKHLFQFSPYPEYAGTFRTCNNRIHGSQVETVDYTKIYEKLYLLNHDVKELLNKKDNLSFCDYIDRCVIMHHDIVITHPFNDGNGRVARGFLNWLLRLKNMPPVYIKSRYKGQYHKALEKAYNTGNYSDLQILFYKTILSSLVELNEIQSQK